MQLVYEQKFQLTTGMFDECSNIIPYALLDLFQTIAGIHATKLGIGSSYCTNNNYGWILARQEVNIYKSPSPEEIVIVKTFPHTPGKIEFKREYELRSLSGDIYAIACAMWVLLDFNTNKMIRSTNIYPNGEFLESTLFNDKLSKPMSVDKTGKFITTYQVEKSDIDLYHHMNNAKYAQLIFNNYDYDASNIMNFKINYQNEIKEKEIMHIYKLIDNDITYITGIKEDVIIFTSSIKTKGE